MQAPLTVPSWFLCWFVGVDGFSFRLIVLYVWWRQSWRWTEAAAVGGGGG